MPFRLIKFEEHLYYAQSQGHMCWLSVYSSLSRLVQIFAIQYNSLLVTCGYLNLNQLKLIKMLIPHSHHPLFMYLPTFQVLSNYMWLVATVLDSIDKEHFHHHRIHGANNYLVVCFVIVISFSYSFLYYEDVGFFVLLFSVLFGETAKNGNKFKAPSSSLSE